MKLRTEESVVTQEGASHFREFIAVGGELILTTKRLVFNSTSRLCPESRLEINLNRIDKIDYFKTLNINPNGIMLLMSDGSIESFMSMTEDNGKLAFKNALGSISNPQFHKHNYPG
jgi:hypothetical protein